MSFVYNDCIDFKKRLHRFKKAYSDLDVEYQIKNHDLVSIKKKSY